MNSKFSKKLLAYRKKLSTFSAKLLAFYDKLLALDQILKMNFYKAQDTENIWLVSMYHCYVKIDKSIIFKIEIVKTFPFLF